MKLKSIVIKGIVIACFFLGGIVLHAQGLYSSNDNTTINSPSSNQGGMFKALPGGDQSDKGNAPGGESPIGEGFLILTLFSGAYALVKRNIKNKHED